MNLLSLVTARGGSKGVPRKNVRQAGGKPLIAWTIEAALQSGCAGRVIVSTDDAEIAAVSRRYGAEVPFMRPPELAGDTSAHVAVVEHAIRWMADHDGGWPERVLLLQPTSPLRTAADVREIVSLALQKDADAVVSVTKMRPHPHYAMQLEEDQRLVGPPPASTYVRRQDLPPVYVTNGALYLIRSKTLLAAGTFLPANTLAYVMPPERSLDVDTEWDLHLADLVLGSGTRGGESALSWTL